MQNLARAGFKVVVAHGHGPSTNAFTEQEKTYTEKYGLQVYTLWNLGYKEKEGIMTDHAAANETSFETRCMNYHDVKSLLEGDK